MRQRRAELQWSCKGRLMSEWWTYSLSDFLLFSPRTYYRLFELYNLAIWPAQLLALVLGVALLALMIRRPAWHGRAIAAILAGCWLWVAWAYLLTRYDTINWAARYFAAGFALEAVLLALSGVIGDRLTMRAGGTDLASRAGLGLFLYALIALPLIGPLLIGRPWTQAELFGLAPDPTIVATLGVLVAADRPSWHLAIVPLAWCAIAGATLWTMGSPDALVLPAAAVLAVAVTTWKTLARSGKGAGL
jgi:uncharacterized protein DUF6064